MSDLDKYPGWIRVGSWVVLPVLAAALVACFLKGAQEGLGMLQKITSN